MVINHAEATNNGVAGRKFGVTEGNIHRWWQMKDKLRNVNLSQKQLADLRKDTSIS
jgi:hypothetical protein